MAFFDRNPFDFDAQDLKKAMDLYGSLSEQERGTISRMARDLFGSQMEEAMSAGPDTQEEVPEEESGDKVMEVFALSPLAFSRLNSQSLDWLQDALELEEFYSEDEQADFSPVVLLYGKALLAALRIFLSEAGEDASRVENQSIFELVSSPLLQSAGLEPVLFNQAAVLLSRGMSSRISKEEAGFFKNQLIESRIFERLLSEND